MKKKISIFLTIILILTLLTACGGSKENRIVLYSSGADYENEYYLERLEAQFPEYDIVLEYLTTGNHAAKLKAEGVNTEADISLDLEYMYLETIKENLADLSDYDLSVFTDDLIDPDSKYLPAMRNSASIILNMDILNEKGLTEPTSYKDLLKPEYKGLISMPNPKSSGTGYSFLKSLVNSWGEDAAFDYFDELSNNILSFTSSGMGPLNAVVQGEVGIAMGMTAQIVDSINSGINLKIVSFAEGTPYNAYGHAMIKGKEERPEVKAVFDFFYDELIADTSAKFYPEALFKDKQFTITGYPTDLDYADMGDSSAAEKERLMDRWQH